MRPRVLSLICSASCLWFLADKAIAETLVLRISTAAPIEIRLATGTKAGAETPLEADERDVSLATDSGEQSKGIQSIGAVSGTLTALAEGLEVGRLQTTVVININGEPRVFDVVATFQRPDSVLAETPIEVAYTAVPRDAKPGQQPIRGRLPATLGMRP